MAHDTALLKGVDSSGGIFQTAASDTSLASGAAITLQKGSIASNSLARQN